MNCESCLAKLSAWIDDELDPVEGVQLEQHLAQCDSCRRAYLELREVDERLSALAIPTGARDRLLDQIDPIISPSVDSARRVNRRRAMSLVAALAASVLLMMVYWWPEQPKPTQTPPVARLVRSTGIVQQFDPQTQQWRELSDNNINAMNGGTRLRTSADSVCEIETVDRTSLRLGTSAEIVILASSHIQVVQGRVWSRVGDRQPLRVDTPPPIDFHEERDAGSLFTLRCPGESEFQWNVSDQESVFQSLTDEGGDVQIQSFQCRVGGKETVSIKSSTDIARRDVDPLAAKVWQIPLLAVDQTTPELGGLLEPLLIQMGRTKTGYLQEQQIRALGPAGAIPLLAYVQSRESRDKPYARLQAMRIASETVDQSAHDRLDAIAKDTDPAIANLAKAAMERLAGDSGNRQ